MQRSNNKKTTYNWQSLFSYEVSLAFGLTVQQLPQTLNEINDIINVLLRGLHIERSIILGVFVSFLLLAKES